MQLILNTYGAYLHRQGELFRVKVNDTVQEISARKVQSILVGTAATFSTDAVKLALENNIDILFLDEFGNPYGRVWHGRLGSTARIRRKQLEVSLSQKGLDLAVSWVRRKLENNIALLKEMRERRARLSAELTERITKLETLASCLSDLKGVIDERRQEMLGIEGTAGRVYFDALSLLVPDSFKFNGRSRNPAEDEFNCLLNYSYGVLYGIVERACVLAGLDPYVGIMHTDNYNKPSLVFDLIENYRIWADETVLGLFSSKSVKKALFDPLQNGLTLNKEGKAVLLDRLMKHLDEQIRYRGRNIKRRDIVQLDCHGIAKEMLEGHVVNETEIE